MSRSGRKERYVIDTNVPVVANGRLDNPDKPVYDRCRESAIKFLQRVLKSGIVLLDSDGAIQEEYKGRLHSSGQGVGDRFFREILQKQIVQEVDLHVKDGAYQDLPREIVDAGFDEDDRKFAALAKKTKARVVNAVDRDWLDHCALLQKHGIHVRFVCGEDSEGWFERRG